MPRHCDNCGVNAVMDETSCPSCGKPFPPPVPREPQRPLPVASTSIRTPEASYSQRTSRTYHHRTETYRYRGSTNVRLERPRDATSAYTMGALSIVFSFIFGLLGLVLGIMAVYLGRKGRREGLAKADAAVKLGYMGIGLSILMMMVFGVFIYGMFSMA